MRDNIYMPKRMNKADESSAARRSP
jgi:hypothetical protein